MKKIFLYVLIACIIACKKETQTLPLLTANELYPIAVGQVFKYRLDSSTLQNFGGTMAIKSYIAKDTVESSFVDVQGRTNFRIFRYLTDTLQSTPWKFAATHVATINGNKIEYADNNLKYIKLVDPVSANTTWKGNIYINTVLPSPYYFLDDWDYRYTNLNNSFTCLKGTLQNTFTVTQQDYEFPKTGFDKNVFCQKSYSIEVYAKGVGLIYKDFIYYTWQNGMQKFEEGSYGIKLNLIQ